MGHAQEVACLIVGQYTVYGLVANDDALLVIELTRVRGHIAARNVHGLRVGQAGLQLGRLAYGYVVGLVRHEILRLALAMDARLKHECS